MGTSGIPTYQFSVLTSCSVCGDNDEDSCEYSCEGGGQIVQEVWEGSTTCSGSSTRYDWSGGYEELYGDCIELTCGTAQLALKSVLVTALPPPCFCGESAHCML